MKGPLPAVILVSSNGKRDRIDNNASVEFLLSRGMKVVVGINPDTGNLLITEHSEASTITRIIAP